MGVRGELFSTRVLLQNRTYFFNVKENRMGDLYLNIVESKNREAGGFERQSVILFAEDLQEFLKGFDESLHVLEKAVREKRKGGAGQGRLDKGGGDRPERGGPDRDRPGRGRPERGRPGRDRQGYGTDKEKPGRDKDTRRKTERSGDGKSRVPSGRKVIVRRHD